MEIEKYNKSLILDGSRYNGRVNIIENPDPDALFKMHERIAFKIRQLVIVVLLPEMIGKIICWLEYSFLQEIYKFFKMVYEQVYMPCLKIKL